MGAPRAFTTAQPNTVHCHSNRRRPHVCLDGDARALRSPCSPTQGGAPHPPPYAANLPRHAHQTPHQVTTWTHTTNPPPSPIHPHPSGLGLLGTYIIVPPMRPAHTPSPSPLPHHPSRLGLLGTYIIVPPMRPNTTVAPTQASLCRMAPRCLLMARRTSSPCSLTVCRMLAPGVLLRGCPGPPWPTSPASEEVKVPVVCVLAALAVEPTWIMAELARAPASMVTVMVSDRSARGGGGGKQACCKQ
jgi:hypothetical protein